MIETKKISANVLGSFNTLMGLKAQKNYKEQQEARRKILDSFEQQKIDIEREKIKNERKRINLNVRIQREKEKENKKNEISGNLNENKNNEIGGDLNG